MNIMKSITLNDKTYDSFNDQTAIKSINEQLPDENGDIILIPSFTDAAKELLITILTNLNSDVEQAENIETLKNLLLTNS